MLLEEPYSYDGALAGTGHTAVLPKPRLRGNPNSSARCRQPGERWRRDQPLHTHCRIRLDCDPFDSLSVRGRKSCGCSALCGCEAGRVSEEYEYRRSHLEVIAPDDADPDEIPKGDWVQLKVGSIRTTGTSYGFQIETTAAQDDARSSNG